MPQVLQFFAPPALDGTGSPMLAPLLLQLIVELPEYICYTFASLLLPNLLFFGFLLCQKDFLAFLNLTFVGFDSPLPFTFHIKAYHLFEDLLSSSGIVPTTLIYHTKS